MSESFLLTILIMLIAALILGEAFKRIKLPVIVGHLLAGVIIGPSLLNIVHPSESFSMIIDLSIFFIMLLAGLHLRPEEIRRAGKNSIILSILAFVIPFGAAVEIASLFGLPLLTSLFLGLALAITAIPVSAAVLMEFGLLKSRLGTTVITAAIIDDVLSLVVLAIIIQLAANGAEGVDYPEISFSVVKIVAFIGGIFLLDFIIKKTMHRRPIKFLSQPNIMKSREVGFGMLLISAFAISLIAENVGLHFVIGTFFAGLIIYDQIIGKRNFEKVNSVFTAITFGLFSPIFFAFIGIQFHLQSIFDSLWLFIVLLAAAVGGKIAGSFIGARIAGFSNSESLTIGNLMNSRGMVGLVIASIGLELGIIDIALFAVVVGIVFITTIMAPVLARITISHSSEEKSKEKPN